MPIYHSLGNIPPKRHTIFEKSDGAGYYYEQLFGTEGFHGFSSLLYHTHRPTEVKEVKSPIDTTPDIAFDKSLTARKLISFDIAPKDDFLESRTPLLVNNDVHIGVIGSRKSMKDYFYNSLQVRRLPYYSAGNDLPDRI
jgi:homogentisate 1,2-dioxygenase